MQLSLTANLSLCEIKVVKEAASLTQYIYPMKHAVDPYLRVLNANNDILKAFFVRIIRCMKTIAQHILLS